MSFHSLSTSKGIHTWAGSCHSVPYHGLRVSNGRWTRKHKSHRCIEFQMKYSTRNEHQTFTRKRRDPDIPATVLRLPHLEEVELYSVNTGQNKVGLVVDPERDGLPFSFAVEVFEAGSVVEMATNPGFELFYVLQGSGTAFCFDDASEDGPASMMVEFGVGDSLLFPPRSVHGVRCKEDESVVVLGLMLHAPGQGVAASDFVEWVTASGPKAGPLSREQLEALFHTSQTAPRANSQLVSELGQERREGDAPPPHRAFRGGEMHITANVDDVDATRAARWPAHRPMAGLLPKHLHGAQGIATVPTNKLLLVFDSRTLPFNFALEMFDVDHVTPLHSHPAGHELFYILKGEGEAICDGYSWPVKAGDTCVFPVNSVHGLNNTGSSKMCTLELMVPADPECLAHDGAPSWDTTCLVDGATGVLACSELGFSDAIITGSDASALSEDELCGFAPRC
mmetsp:Transcript_8589/g.16266  ORF Transcript_8589/g.16266 Transcript_8589/m.16266 type:complete len:452 (-) Transcript_8589:62-1417(-)